MNERFSGNSKYEEYSESFEKLWIFAKPMPYQIFIRILFELYASLESNVVKSPYKDHKAYFNELAEQVIAYCEANGKQYHIKDGTITTT